MKTIILISTVVVVAMVLSAFVIVRKNTRSRLISSTPASFYDLSYTDIHGNQVKMSDYRGKYVLCVNVASECGNTPQYEGLQLLADKHKDDLVVIGFPCNQFMGQEPGDEKTIEDFCKKNYGVTFPLSSKIDVKGSGQHPVYTWLTSKELNGVSDATIGWNFHKILVGKDGEWVASFNNKLDPQSPEIESKLR